MLIAGSYGVQSEMPDGIGTELRSYAGPRAGGERGMVCCVAVLAR